MTINSPSSIWRCKVCGSDQWIGWRAGPAHEGFPRKAQCVPCGHVQALPEGDGDNDD
jgi:rubredoxin